MICFLGDDLCALLRSLMSLFMLKDKIEKPDCDKSLYSYYKAVDMGFSAVECDRHKMEVKMSARDCLVEIRAGTIQSVSVLYRYRHQPIRIDTAIMLYRYN